MCEAFNKTPVTRRGPHLRLYSLTLPVASTTYSERAYLFCPPQLKNYLRRTMKQDRLNNCLFIRHCHKLITGSTVDTVKIAKRFACANKLATQRTFWEIGVGVCAWLCVRWHISTSTFLSGKWSGRMNTTCCYYEKC